MNHEKNIQFGVINVEIISAFYRNPFPWKLLLFLLMDKIGSCISEHRFSHKMLFREKKIPINIEQKNEKHLKASKTKAKCLNCT